MGQSHGLQQQVKSDYLQERELIRLRQQKLRESADMYRQRRLREIARSRYRIRRNEEPSTSAGTSAQPSDGFPFTSSYITLAQATDYFNPKLRIGEGGFGPVFKGSFNKNQFVAIKQLNLDGPQGTKEFLVEVLMLCLLHHPNLVKLVGYCGEGPQRLIVYEYMPLGSLDSHLHGLEPEKKPLDWDSRMKIAIGVAKGMNYLHNEANPPVIYRDVKSSNVLLDKEFHPKLSDFGHAKFGPQGDRTHVSTRVMGAPAYCAPEYASTGKLTFKSDVYSYGVLLLEIITGQEASDLNRGYGKELLVDWVREKLRYQKNVDLADPRLKGQFPKPILSKVMRVALTCIQEDPTLRPSMTDVMNSLEFLCSEPYEKYRLLFEDEGVTSSAGANQFNISTGEERLQRSRSC